jgi:hypothetical protein
MRKLDRALNVLKDHVAAGELLCALLFHEYFLWQFLLESYSNAFTLLIYSHQKCKY